MLNRRLGFAQIQLHVFNYANRSPIFAAVTLNIYFLNITITPRLSKYNFCIVCQDVAYPGIILSREMHLSPFNYFEATTGPWTSLITLFYQENFRIDLQNGEELTCLTSKTVRGNFWKRIDRPACHATATDTQCI
jgi:hypothetical protein